VTRRGTIKDPAASAWWVGVRQFWVQRPKTQQNECYRHGRSQPQIWPGLGLVNGAARKAMAFHPAATFGGKKRSGRRRQC